MRMTTIASGILKFKLSCELGREHGAHVGAPVRE